MTSLMRLSNTSKDFACVWQPRNEGTVATKYPSSSCSMITLNSFIKFALSVFRTSYQKTKTIAIACTQTIAPHPVGMHRSVEKTIKKITASRRDASLPKQGRIPTGCGNGGGVFSTERAIPTGWQEIPPTLRQAKVAQVFRPVFNIFSITSFFSLTHNQGFTL